MALYEDLYVDQGADARWRLRLLDADASYRDLANTSVRGKINRSYGADSSEAISFDARIVSPASDGIIDIILSNTQTDSLTRRRYVYDVEIEYTDSASGLPYVERILEGKIIVSKSVTK